MAKTTLRLPPKDPDKLESFSDSLFDIENETLL